ncbi:MAG: SUMF1/EgtB/PvdO family nonheme iron enzyme [bacterium]
MTNAFFVWPASFAAAFPLAHQDSSTIKAESSRVEADGARGDQTAPTANPPSTTRASVPPDTTFTRDIASAALDELVKSKHIDEAIRTRALDVLFTTETKSDGDVRLALIFRQLIESEGVERDELLRRLRNNIVRALDPVLERPEWKVARGDGLPRINSELAVHATDLHRALEELSTRYPLQVRDTKTGIIFRLVPGGYIPLADGGRGEYVEPFYIANTEVDWCDWFRLKGGERASLMPVEGLTWEAVEEFVRSAQLSLPTTIEWEFAARSGIAADYWMVDPRPGEIRCNVDAAGRANIRELEEFRRNYFDLYHIHGNVAEWCAHPLGKHVPIQPACGGNYLDPMEQCTATSAKLLLRTDANAARGVGFRPIRRIKDGVTRVSETESRPLSVVVVGDNGPLDTHWRAEILQAMPDPVTDKLDSDYCEAVRKAGYPWEVLDLETGVRMRLVPRGSFISRGSGDRAFRVLIEHPFYLGVSEVTREDWDRLAGGVGPREKALLPIDGQTWSACRAYLRKASAGLRFPHEFEWEWACTFGKEQDFAWDNAAAVREDRFRCNHNGFANADSGLVRSGDMLASPLGFRGLHGNAREWCNNHFSLPDIVPELEDRPRGGEGGFSFRGGGVRDDAADCRAFVRKSADVSAPIAGLRIARSVPSKTALIATDLPNGAKILEDDVSRPRAPLPSELKPSDGGTTPGVVSPGSEPKSPSAAPAKPAEVEQPQPYGPPGDDERRKGKPGQFQGRPGSTSPTVPPGDPDDGPLPPEVPEGPVETGTAGG